MLKEISNSIRATLYQRVSSPLYGTYIFSWCLYNWAIFLPLLFGDESFDTRIETFRAALYSPESKFIYSTLLIPMLMTIVILCVQPILQRFLYIYTEWNRSEGLKKRDKFNSETMLTLEQSNELRASVQKVQQFHQEVMKNKNIEIEEYKRQLDLKESLNEKISKKNTDLIEASAAAESDKSTLSTEIAQSKTEIAQLTLKYERLAKTFSKQRKRQLALRYNLTPKGSYANDAFLKDIENVLNIEDSFSVGELSKSLNSLLAISISEKWKNTCYIMLVESFGKVWSFNMADSYFEELIKPHLKYFNDDVLKLLIYKMNSNDQINGRKRAENDLKLVKSVVAARAA